MYKAQHDFYRREDNRIVGQRGDDLVDTLLNFRQTRKFCDITLVAGDRSFYAHSCILAASSPYFMGLLRSGMSEVSSKSLRVDLAFLSASTDSVNSVIDHMYGGTFEVDFENVFEILTLADYFLLSDLKETICDYLCDITSVNDPALCLQILRQAELYACKDLYGFVDRYWKSRFYELSHSDAFNELTLRELGSLLDSDELIGTANELLTAIVKWVGHSPELRKMHLNQLLLNIDLDVISEAEVRDLLTEENIDVELSCFDERKVAELSPEEPRPGQETMLVFDAETAMCYVPLTRECCSLNAMPAQRKSFKVVHLNGMVYVIGGMVDERLSVTVWCYNTETGVWGEVAPMLKTASSFDVAALGGCLYAVGGPKLEYSVQKYNPKINAWCFVTPMEVQREEHCVVSFQDKYLFVIGGMTHDTASMYTVERYDPAMDTWTYMAQLNIGRIESSAIALDDKIFVCCGYGGSHHRRHNSCEMYNGPTNTWTLIESSRARRRSAGIAIVGGMVHLFGGCTRKFEFTPVSERFNETSGKWECLQWGSEWGNVKWETSKQLKCCTVTLSGKAMCRNLKHKLKKD